MFDVVTMDQIKEMGRKVDQADCTLVHSFYIELLTRLQRGENTDLSWLFVKCFTEGK